MANGAGKTTLLRLLLGLASPAQGEVLIGGGPAASLSPREIATRVAYVPQVHMTPFPFTVREVVGAAPETFGPASRTHIESLREAV